MITQIQFEDIRKGDRIRVNQEYARLGVEFVHGTYGTAHTLSDGVWYTEEGGFIVQDRVDDTITIRLLDRPTPPLPTEPGTVFRATKFAIGAAEARKVFVTGRYGCEVDYIDDRGDYWRSTQITAWEPIENGDK